MRPVLRLTSVVPALLAAALAVGCASAPPAQQSGPPPTWFTDRDKAYPDAMFLCSEGSGITRRAAESDAVAALAKVFKTSVKVNTTAQTNYLSFDSGGKSAATVNSSLDQRIEIAASQDLVNVMFTKPYTEKDGTVNVLAYIDRAKTAAIYEETVKEKGKAVADYLRRASASPRSLERYALRETAYRTGVQVSDLLGQLLVIDTQKSKQLSGSVDLPKLADLRDQAKRGLVFNVSLSGDSSGKVGAVLESLMSETGLKPKAGQGLSVRGSWKVEDATLNSQFKSVRWTLDANVKDESGTVVCKLFKEDRSSAKTTEQAKALALDDLREALRPDLQEGLGGYLSQLLGKPKD